jgi:hypothetical protein
MNDFDLTFQVFTIFDSDHEGYMQLEIKGRRRVSLIDATCRSILAHAILIVCCYSCARVLAQQEDDARKHRMTKLKTGFLEHPFPTSPPA